jgi:CheY-like chemotaxis protein/anti-sigma regulatory factor (Ser/Thr protein kinase)
MAERKQVELDVQLDESLPPVSGDPARLQQVASNLLTNAIKFTPDRGRVTVTVDAAEGQGRLRVTDTGVGIEPDFLPHLFDLFSQEERGQTRARGGLGLGLAIVRSLVEAHGGTIRAESPGRGRGATFTVLLPLMQKHQARDPREDHEVPGVELNGGIQGVRILVVEDDPGTREALTEMLRLSGAEVRAARSASEAFAELEELRPQVLVCDIAMPDEDGYGLLARIRALGPERGGAVPALALTALASEEDRRRAFEAGFQMHMAKPVDIDRLVRALSVLLKVRGDSSEARDAP